MLKKIIRYITFLLSAYRIRRQVSIEESREECLRRQKNAFPEEGKDRICSDHGYKGGVKTERIRLVIEFGIKDRLVGSVPVKVIDDEDVAFVFDAQ